jgi:hypothetical protein
MKHIVLALLFAIAALFPAAPAHAAHALVTMDAPAGVATTSPSQPGDFTLWLQAQAVVEERFPPVWEDRDSGKSGSTQKPAVIYCTYQPCPSGQFCAFCNRSYVCLFNYPDPDFCPQGCVCGPQ